MRFRPANIRVINRRDSVSATTDTASSRHGPDHCALTRPFALAPLLLGDLLAGLERRAHANHNGGRAHSNNKLT
jgi:hypothetical protein